MKSKFCRLFGNLSLFALLYLTIGCSEYNSQNEKGDNAPSPSNAYALTQQQLNATLEMAKSGNVSAMNRLSFYYMIYSEEEDKGLYWLERAGDAGDQDARAYLLGYYAERKDPERQKYSEILRQRWNLKK
jgi:TPR repeat protein